MLPKEPGSGECGQFQHAPRERVVAHHRGRSHLALLAPNSWLSHLALLRIGPWELLLGAGGWQSKVGN